MSKLLCSTQLLGQHLINICKCHGVSGSCTVTTCWRQLAAFPVIGSELRVAYDRASLVAATVSATLDTTSPSASDDVNWRPGTALRLGASGSTRSRVGRLVYAADSPDYCDRSTVAPGSRGRQCYEMIVGRAKRIAENRCDHLCCGRGHDVLLKTIRRRCHCHVIWCCDVRCKECVDVVETHTCN